MTKIGINNFFLNWSKVPPSLENDHWMGKEVSIRDDDSFYKIEPREWDSCIYLDVVSPATPHSTS